MANYSGTRVAYVASSASVGADTVVLTDGGFSVKVTNITGTAPLYFTVSQPGGPCPVPTTAAAANVFVVPSAVNSSVNVRHAGQFGSVVQVVSTGSPSYMVEVQGNHATS